MADPRVQNISLDQAAIHVDVEPGGEIVLRGSCTLRHDGSVVDAVTTTWPKEAPGGASVDAGGLIEVDPTFGFRLISRDLTKHEARAVATGDDGTAACAALGVQAPCLPVRLRPLAQERLLTAAAVKSDLDNCIKLEVPEPLVPVVPPSSVPYLEVAGGLLAAVALGVFAFRYRKRQAASPAGQLLALGKRVRDKLARADVVVAAPLAPAIETALKALRGRRIDAASAEGKRITAVLQRVEVRLEESAERARADQEQQAADELVREFESALEAADEATLASKG